MKIINYDPRSIVSSIFEERHKPYLIEGFVFNIPTPTPKLVDFWNILIDGIPSLADRDGYRFQVDSATLVYTTQPMIYHLVMHFTYLVQPYRNEDLFHGAFILDWNDVNNPNGFLDYVLKCLDEFVKNA